MKHKKHLVYYRLMNEDNIEYYHQLVAGVDDVAMVNILLNVFSEVDVCKLRSTLKNQLANDVVNDITGSDATAEEHATMKHDNVCTDEIAYSFLDGIRRYFSQIDSEFVDDVMNEFSCQLGEVLDNRTSNLEGEELVSALYEHTETMIDDAFDECLINAVRAV